MVKIFGLGFGFKFWVEILG